MSLTHKIYENLKEDIINQKFKENSIITEKELAKKYKKVILLLQFHLKTLKIFFK